jgi:hypothetical protein
MEKFFETAGVEKTVLRREAFTQHVKREYEELGQLVKELGLKQDG